MKAIIAAFLANLGIAIAKFVGFVFTGSASMLAEAIHSAADTTNQALLMLGRRQAAEPATPEHPFGYGRERFFWSFVVALVIFSFGARLRLVRRHREGARATRARSRSDGPSASCCSRSCSRATRSAPPSTRAAALKGDESWWEFIRRSKVPELPGALARGLRRAGRPHVRPHRRGRRQVTDNARFDAVGSIAIGVLLAVIAVTLVVEMKSLLIGESATPEQRQAIIDAIESHTTNVATHPHAHRAPRPRGIARRRQDRVRRRADRRRSSPRAIDSVEVAIRAAVPDARLIYIEPDIYRGTRSNGSAARGTPP